MPALQRAVALPERDDVALAVGDELHLDVARRRDLPLEVDGSVAERRRRLVRPGGQRGGEILGARDAAHAPASPACGRLHQQREPDALGRGDDRLDLVGPIHRRRLQGARHRRHADRARRAVAR